MLPLLAQMAFDLSKINISDIIFQVLKVTPTGNLQADFLNLIFFPHVIILFWLFIIARGPIFMAVHRGLGTLLAIALYIFVIWYGWYPMIANLSLIWLGITIVVSFFYFMMPKFLHPGTTSSVFGLGALAGGAISKRRNIDKTIARLQEDLRDAQNELNNATSDRQRGEIQTFLQATRQEIRRLEKEKQL